MIDATMSPAACLKDWREFRKMLTDDLSEKEILDKVAMYWVSVPTVKYYLDFDNPKSWPTPWELINSGEFCSTGIAYLMLKTLELAPTEKFKNSEIKLLWIKDLQIEDLLMVLVINSTYVLNYYHGEVKNWADIQNSCQIICDYLNTNLN
jgi:hypothetical protein